MFAKGWLGSSPQAAHVIFYLLTNKTRAQLSKVNLTRVFRPLTIAKNFDVLIKGLSRSGTSTHNKESSLCVLRSFMKTLYILSIRRLWVLDTVLIDRCAFSGSTSTFLMARVMDLASSISLVIKKENYVSKK